MDVRQIADLYQIARGLPVHGDGVPASVPVSAQCELADYYERARHAPESVIVAKSYFVLARETVSQYNMLRACDIGFTAWTGAGEPYANSGDMLTDLKRGHIFYLPTRTAGELASFHPMAQVVETCDGRLVLNDVFRAVHDCFGHGVHGWQFGPKGEYNAWRTHARMYSRPALLALACETRAQNAWTNYGRHIRRLDGSIPGTGEPDYIPLSSRPFAAQKCVLLPVRYCQP